MSFEEALSEQARKLQVIFDQTPTSILLLFVVTGCAVIGVSVCARHSGSHTALELQLTLAIVLLLPIHRRTRSTSLAKIRTTIPDYIARWRDERAARIALLGGYVAGKERDRKEKGIETEQVHQAG